MFMHKQMARPPIRIDGYKLIGREAGFGDGKRPCFSAQKAARIGVRHFHVGANRPNERPFHAVTMPDLRETILNALGR